MIARSTHGKIWIFVGAAALMLAAAGSVVAEQKDPPDPPYGGSVPPMGPSDCLAIGGKIYDYGSSWRCCVNEGTSEAMCVSCESSGCKCDFGCRGMATLEQRLQAIGRDDAPNRLMDTPGAPGSSTGFSCPPADPGDPFISCHCKGGKGSADCKNMRDIACNHGEKICCNAQACFCRVFDRDQSFPCPDGTEPWKQAPALPRELPLREGPGLSRIPGKATPGSGGLRETRPTRPDGPYREAPVTPRDSVRKPGGAVLPSPPDPADEPGPDWPTVQ